MSTTKTMNKTMNKTTILNIIQDFKTNGIGVLDTLSEDVLTKIILAADKAYHNNKPFMTDTQYDILFEYVQHKYPNNTSITLVGAPIHANAYATKQKAVLPYEMWSMNKIKPDTNALDNWCKKYKGPYLVSCKLDGVSGLYTTEGEGEGKSNTPKLFTRGDGKIGQDISHFIPYLKRCLPTISNVVIRGEFIMKRDVFKAKYQSKFANSRNMIAGIINQKTVNPAIHDIDFVAYEVIKPLVTPIEQMKILQKMGALCVKHAFIHKKNMKGQYMELTNQTLSKVLVEWREKSIYDIDGVVVTNDAIYERKSANPEHAFAFKMVLTEQIAEAKVVDVIWTPSKDGYLKPRVKFDLIQLGGVSIEYATGFNASFILQNKIGVGALIEIIRSGDVIPYIRKVIVPAEEPKMPSVDYVWNDTKVDVVILDINKDLTVKEKNITGFFRGIGVVGLSSGNISRIIEAGYDTIPKIVRMSVDDLLTIDGFQLKLAKKIHDGIEERLKNASITSLMAASNIFGRGFSEKKIKLIIDSEPEILTDDKYSYENWVDVISIIKGMGQKSAESFACDIPRFVAFVKEIGLEERLYETGNMLKGGIGVEGGSCSGCCISYDDGVKEHPLYEKTIVMTGFRDAKLTEQLAQFSASVSNSVSKKTFALLVKNDDVLDSGPNKKMVEAQKNGVAIYTREQFIHKFKLA